MPTQTSGFLASVGVSSMMATISGCSNNTVGFMLRLWQRGCVGLARRDWIAVRLIFIDHEGNRIAGELLLQYLDQSPALRPQ